VLPLLQLDLLKLLHLLKHLVKHLIRLYSKKLLLFQIWELWAKLPQHWILKPVNV
jgi:hypothetical protein